MRHVVLLAITSLLLVTSGCKTQCRLLTEKQCDCTTNSQDKTACLTRAQAQDSAYNSPPLPEDEARCQLLLDTCDCHLVDTQSGKERCGLAEPADAGN